MSRISAYRPEQIERIKEWLTRHGIDLGTIPAEANITWSQGSGWPGSVCIEQYIFDSRGRQMDRQWLRVPMTEDERDVILRAVGLTPVPSKEEE